MQMTKPIGGSQFRRPGVLPRILMVLTSLIGMQTADAASVNETNLVDLIRHSDRIIVGTVIEVSDGFTADNVPYTEVKLVVADTIRGSKDSTYTFRQFGLSKPREINGRTYLGTSPDGWPTWSERERVMLFLSKPARLTGLQTTVGLGQGKLALRAGTLASGTQNQGMFDRVKVSANGLTREQTAMLDGNAESLAVDPFVSLVRRAVDEQWIETGVMRNED
jgi:hypothetical protein